MREIKWEDIWVRFLQHDKVCVYIYIYIYVGRSSCSGLEISQSVIQLDPLNYPTHPTWPASLNGLA